MLKRPQYIALTAVILLALIVLNLPPQTSAHAKLAIGSLFLPLFGLAGSVESVAGRTGNAIVPRKILQAKIKEVLTELIAMVRDANLKPDATALASWWEQINGWRARERCRLRWREL